MNPLVQTILVFIGLFFAGFCLRWLMDWQEMRRLRRQAKSDAWWINDLREKLNAAPAQGEECWQRMSTYRVDTSKAVNDAYQSGFIAGRKARALSTK